jgi:hypothetical protein
MLPAMCRRWKPIEAAPPGVIHVCAGVRSATAAAISSEACISVCAAGITTGGIPGIGPRSQGSAMTIHLHSLLR